MASMLLFHDEGEIQCIKLERVDFSLGCISSTNAYHLLTYIQQPRHAVGVVILGDD